MDSAEKIAVALTGFLAAADVLAKMTSKDEPAQAG
jgi:hypothetical protein